MKNRKFVLLMVSFLWLGAASGVDSRIEEDPSVVSLAVPAAGYALDAILSALTVTFVGSETLYVLSLDKPNTGTVVFRGLPQGVLKITKNDLLKKTSPQDIATRALLLRQAANYQNLKIALESSYQQNRKFADSGTLENLEAFRQEVAKQSKSAGNVLASLSEYSVLYSKNIEAEAKKLVGQVQTMKEYISGDGYNPEECEPKDVLESYLKRGYKITPSTINKRTVEIERGGFQCRIQFIRENRHYFQGVLGRDGKWKLTLGYTDQTQHMDIINNFIVSYDIGFCRDNDGNIKHRSNQTYMAERCNDLKNYDFCEELYKNVGLPNGGRC